MYTIVVPRKPLLALLMSLILPGFGQLYNGEPNRAIWFFLVYFGLGAPALALIALYVPSSAMLAALILALCMILALWVYGMIDAWTSARRQPDYMVRSWQSSGMYVLVLLTCALTVQPLLASYVRNHEVESFRIPSSSMQPTLMPDDFIFADMRYNCPECKQAVSRGDIVIFTFPNNRTLYYLKRIVGLPGERVQIKGHEVLINGQPLNISDVPGNLGTQVSEGNDARRWQVWWSIQQTQQPELDVTVPAGEVFVLGDNRNLSVDSRDIGCIPLQDVVGRVRQIWFSRADAAIRWNRMGKVVD